jgi:perosamine synthetase
MTLISEKILTAGPTISDLEVQYGVDAVKNGWNSNWAHYLNSFEKEFAAYIGVAHAMTTSSCTGAMHLTLLAAGIGPGDEVVVPELTWVATASAVKYVGATPVFCDVDRQSWTMLPEAFEKCITPRTRAVMPVHLYGHSCDMDPILEIARKHDLFVLEDSAQSVGAEYKGKKTGSFGNAAAFSFQGAKALVTGEGGMIATSDQALLERARFKGDHGRSADKALFNIEIGYKYKMSNVQAALGLAQIQRVDEIVNRKIEIFNWYKKRLADIEELQLNGQANWAKNIFWMTSIVLSDKIPMERDNFIIELGARKVDSRPIFYPISAFPMFEQQNNPNAYHVGLRGINLPSGHDRTEEEIDYICHHIRELVGKGKGQYALGGWLKYREDVNASLAAVKDSSQLDASVLPIMQNGQKVGTLVPVTEATLASVADIEMLQKWRAASQEWFPSTTTITAAGTKRWTEAAVLKTPDRVLFFVCDATGTKIGHLGLFRFDYHQRTCELDNVIRGEAGTPGLMAAASEALMGWARQSLQIKTFYLRVFSDNQKAISLYEKLGFHEIRRDPMIQKKKDNGDTYWTESMLSPYLSIARYFVTMQRG